MHVAIYKACFTDGPNRITTFLHSVALLALACAGEGTAVELYGFSWSRKQPRTHPIAKEQVQSEPLSRHLSQMSNSDVAFKPAGSTPNRNIEPLPFLTHTEQMRISFVSAIDGLLVESAR